MRNNSFICNFKLPKVFLVAAVLVIALELNLHINEKIYFYEDFRSDSLWQTVLNTWKHSKADIAIVGSSVSHSGVRSNMLLSHLDNTSKKPIVMNYFLYSSNPEGVYRLLADVVLPKVKPKLIVYVVGPNDINGLNKIVEENRKIPEIDLYVRSKALYLMITLFDQYFYTYRYRARIGIWIQLGIDRLFAGKEMNAGSEASVNRGGLKFWERVKESSERYRIGDQSLSNILRMKYLSVKNGADFILVELPPHPRSFTVDGFKERYQEENEILKNYCEKNRINYLDLSEDLMREEYFRDALHLNEKGADVAASILARQPQIMEAVNN